MHDDVPDAGAHRRRNARFEQELAVLGDVAPCAGHEARAVHAACRPVLRYAEGHVYARWLARFGFIGAIEPPLVL